MIYKLSISIIISILSKLMFLEIKNFGVYAVHSKAPSYKTTVVSKPVISYYSPAPKTTIVTYSPIPSNKYVVTTYYTPTANVVYSPPIITYKSYVQPVRSSSLSS